MGQLLVRDKSFYKAMWRIILPVSLQSMVNMGVGLLATIMLGQLGEVPIAASSLANQYVFFFMIMCFGVGGGALVMTAQYMGKDDISSVKKVITLAIRIILAVAVFFSVVTFLFPRQIMSIYTYVPAVIEDGAIFLRFISFSFIFQGLTTTLAIIGRSYGVVRIPLLASASGFAFGAFFNWVFIFGNLGAPEMGIAGAGIAIIIARVVECIIVVGYIMFIDKRVGYRVKNLFEPCKVLIPEYIRIGSPVIITDLFLAIGMSGIAIIMGWVGQAMVAANAIVTLAFQISTVFLMGISNASSILIGASVGEGDKAMAQTKGYTFLIIGAAMGVVAAGLIIAITPLAMNFFYIEPETVPIVNALMFSLALIMPFHCVSQVLTKGILRGGGDTIFLMIADTVFLFVASLPLGWLAAFAFGLSPFWISTFLRTDMLIRSIWCAYRLYSGKWIRTVKTEKEVLSNGTSQS